ncbi:unnamed protein product [Bathycoccus prasinos]
MWEIEWLEKTESRKEEKRNNKKQRMLNGMKIPHTEYESWLEDTSDIVIPRGARREAPIETARACVASDRCLPGEVHPKLAALYTRNANSCWGERPKIGRIERGQRYQYYAIVYPVRKVVRTFESALEVVEGVTGQHWRGFNSEERALEYLCNWERIDAECLAFNREKRKTRWTKMEKIVSEYPSGEKSCTRFVDPTVKDGYKYFPCENEYNTEEPIALGGEQESWSATKLSNYEFGQTRSQTRDLEAAKSLEEMSADKQLENEQKKAAKVDAATSLFVLRDAEKEKGKALHFGALTSAQWAVENVQVRHLTRQASKKLF